MEIYEKEYEDVFDSKESRKRLMSKLDDISINGGIDKFNYAVWAKNEFRVIFNSFWISYLKIFWIERMFMVNGSLRNIGHNNRASDGYFSMFFRNVIGVGREIYSKNPIYTRFKSYYVEMYPWVKDLNGPSPFEDEEPFKFPFKYITPEYLLVAYQVENRMDLLKIADDKKMKYGEFLDFIINQTLCANDALGKNKYRLSFYNQCTHYIRNNDDKRNKKEADKSRKSFMKNKDKNKDGEKIKTSYFYNR